MASLLAYFAHPHCMRRVHLHQFESSISILMGKNSPFPREYITCRRAFLQHPFLFLFVWLCVVCRGWKEGSKGTRCSAARPSTAREGERGRRRQQETVCYSAPFNIQMPDSLCLFRLMRLVMSLKVLSGKLLPELGAPRCIELQKKHSIPTHVRPTCRRLPLLLAKCE